MILYVVRLSGGKLPQTTFKKHWQDHERFKQVFPLSPRFHDGLVCIMDSHDLMQMGYTHVTMRDGMENMIPLIKEKE